MREPEASQGKRVSDRLILEPKRQLQLCRVPEIFSVLASIGVLLGLGGSRSPQMPRSIDASVSVSSVFLIPCVARAWRKLPRSVEA